MHAPHLTFHVLQLAHSCDPSTRPSFTTGSTQLQLIANRPIKKGDELTIAYVDVTQRPGESAEEARRRRRGQLCELFDPLAALAGSFRVAGM